MPGQYTVVLTANGHSYSQPLTIKMDPRVKTPAADLQTQFTLSKQVYDALLPVANATAEAERINEQVEHLHSSATAGPATSALDAFSTKLNPVLGEGGRRARGGAPDSLSAVRAALGTLLGVFQDADVAQTSQAAAAVPELIKAAATQIARWNTFRQQDLPALNQQLRSAGLPEINAAATK
jgi:hypothetical protein